jgi:hypothetical protein
MESVATEMQAEWDRTQETWQNEVRALPEFSGGQLEPALGEVAKLVQRYGGVEARKAFDLTGAGNHPAIVQFLFKIAKDINEQEPVSGTAAPDPIASRAERMYGNKGG